MIAMTKDLLRRACIGHYAVAAPNITNSVEAEAAIAAAEELNAPLILDVLPEAMKIPCPEPFIHWLRERCEQAKTPLSINVDYGGTFAGAVQKIQYGATSIIVNCSNQSFEENAAQVQKVAELAHAAGLACEAELGTGTALTEHCQASRFIQMTGADWLAVAIGTTRGLDPTKEPYVDFDRLHSIRQAVGDAPLGLHGCAGTPPDQLENACRIGINKVNVASDLRKAMMQAVLGAEGVGNVMELAAAGYTKRLAELIQICGSVGKA